MRGEIASAIIGLVASTWLAAIAFGRWMPLVTFSALDREVLVHGRADKWLHVASMLLVTALDQLIGAPEHRKKHRLRVIATATAILIVVMSLAGVLSKTFMGFEESPWVGYDRTIRGFSKINESAEGKDLEEKRISSELAAKLTAAGAPHWKYVYSAGAIPMILVIYLIAFFGSVTAVRRLMREINEAKTWVQKAGIACFATIALFFWTLAVALVFASLSSAIPVLALSLASYFSTGWIVLVAFAVVVLEFWVGDPWFKAIVLASVLPGVAFVMVALLPLVADLMAEIFVGARKRTVQVAHQNLGPAFIPLCMTLGAVVCVIWVLGVVV